MKSLNIRNCEKVLWVDDGDYDTVKDIRWHAVKQLGRYTSIKASVWRASIKKHENIYIHRLIMGAKKGDIIDHKDRDVFNNQKANLRFCTHTQNCQNRKQFSTINRFKGIWKESRRSGGFRWRAAIRVNGKLISLGSFESDVTAAKSYNDAAKKHFGEFAKLNEMTEKPNAA